MLSDIHKNMIKIDIGYFFYTPFIFAKQRMEHFRQTTLQKVK